MIVRMKKLTLLCLRAEVDLTLEALRDLGAVQVVNMKAPAGDELEEEQRLLASAVRADDLLAALEREVGQAKRARRLPRARGRSRATRSSHGSKLRLPAGGPRSRGACCVWS